MAVIIDNRGCFNEHIYIGFGYNRGLGEHAIMVDGVSMPCHFSLTDLELTVWTE